MKKVMLITALALTSFSGAYAAEKAGKIATAPAAQEGALSRLEARKACREKGVKGSEFKACVKNKMEGTHNG